MQRRTPAHSDRFEAERLFTVFNELDIPVETLMATTSLTTFDTENADQHGQRPCVWTCRADAVRFALALRFAATA